MNRHTKGQLLPPLALFPSPHSVSRLPQSTHTRRQHLTLSSLPSQLGVIEEREEEKEKRARRRYSGGQSPAATLSSSSTPPSTPAHLPLPFLHLPLPPSTPAHQRGAESSHPFICAQNTSSSMNHPGRIYASLEASIRTIPSHRNPDTQPHEPPFFGYLAGLDHPSRRPHRCLHH